MRNLLFIVTFGLLGLGTAAQIPEDLHFSVKDRIIIWQQVYESPADSAAVLDYLLGSGIFADVVEISNGVSFTIMPRSIDIQAAGFKRGSMSMYISLYRMTAHGLLQMRDGRYRVTVDRIVFLAEPDTPLEAYALNRESEFKSIFTSMNAAQAIDSELTRLFTIQETEDEDW